MNFDSPYNPKETEDRIYKLWEKSGFFNPDKLPKKFKKPFSIVLPPPNVTGILHIGSAFMIAIEDIMVRHERMSGKKTLWIPGTDHAAIATQSKVENIIYKTEGKRRHDLGREELLRRIKDYAQKSHDIIVKQIKVFGASLDWSREAYTLDKTRERAVYTAFKKMYDGGLIYRDYRIINWDPKGQTTISDDEIIYVENKGTLYTFKYSKNFPISISTTRPETKVGDTAVAINPGDKRYKKYIGKEYDLEFAGEKIHIKVVADNAVDPKFGTGALGVTPAHSHVDWDIAQRHNLPVKPVINELARMAVDSSLLKDKKVTEAREIVVSWLKDNDLLEKTQTINQNVATAERTVGIIEPLPKLQWFIDVNKKVLIPDSKIKGVDKNKKHSLKEIMKAAVANGQIKILPKKFEKVYFHWVDNLRDWCISRQIWFGHRIPVWYHESKCIPKLGHETDIKNCEKIIVSSVEPSCEFCDAKYEQDPDTLDTWFSSGLWTFSTLGWPEKTKDFLMYHPTSVLETGYDIIFFWVARMILMSGYLLGDIPFKTVYFHGLIRNIQGQKISKSLGDNVDPIELANKYGADALRFGLIWQAMGNQDIRWSEEHVVAGKKFCNKVWNATRFVLKNANSKIKNKKSKLQLKNQNLTEADKKILIGLKKTTEEVNSLIEKYEFGKALHKLYDFFWHEYADVYIEASKKQVNREVLLKVHSDLLKLLHPFLPFITEEIWSALNKKNLLLIESWPSNTT